MRYIHTKVLGKRVKIGGRSLSKDFSRRCDFCGSVDLLFHPSRFYFSYFHRFSNSIPDGEWIYSAIGSRSVEIYGDFTSLFAPVVGGGFAVLGLFAGFFDIPGIYKILWGVSAEGFSIADVMAARLLRNAGGSLARGGFSSV